MVKAERPSPTTTTSASTDGWGELDDVDDEMEDVPVEKEPPSRAPPTSKTSHVSSGWDAAEDDDDWSNDWEKPKV